MKLSREVIEAVAGILKQRFNNLTVAETIDLACKIIEVIPDAKKE
jgi:hypothetical protein